MNSIYNLNLNDMEELMVNLGEKKYRAKQLFEWLYQKRVSSYQAITNIKQELLVKINDEYSFDNLKIIEKQESKDGTIKFLFELFDKNLIETVLMKQPYGYSVCVSTQVGCNMGCSFCASGRLAKVRNLSAGEIVLQVLMVQQYLDKVQQRVSHVVIMGIGEPFDNYDAVLKFIRIINNPFGLAIGARHITLSTCGIIAGIKKYQDENLQINLAISLHSAIENKRSKLMPINKKDDLISLKKALKEYQSKTKRRLTFEYIVLNGVNDSKEDAQALIDYSKGLDVYINLIPYNEVSESGFKKVDKKSALAFYDLLKKGGLNVTLRKELGSNIDAACGQLRGNKLMKR